MIPVGARKSSWLPTAEMRGEVRGPVALNNGREDDAEGCNVLGTVSFRITRQKAFGQWLGELTGKG